MNPRGDFALSFVIPVRNDAVRLAGCLRTVSAAAARASAHVECIVADNGSVDDSGAVARSFGARVLDLPRAAVSALRNRAAAEARAGIIAFVDADHEISETWIVDALELFRDSSVAAAGALYLPPPRGTWTQRMYGLLRGRTIGRADADWLGSGNLAVRRDVFVSVRGFDESLETCEDVDFCQRVRRAGGRLVADERLVSVHVGDPATLSDLFRSERWRGRDNLRFSLRSMPHLRDLPSILIPVVDACAALVAGLSVILVPRLGWTALLVGGACVALILALAGLRALRMAVPGRLRTPIEIGRAFAVAATYDAGRACSLLWPATHRRAEAPRLPAVGARP